jgi:purine-nucleoside phosphorylase
MAKLNPNPGFKEARKAAKYILRHVRHQPRVGMVLGSGLGAVAGRLKQATALPYESIPNFPQPTVKGHGGRLHVGEWGGVPVAILEGRMHLYEGYTAAQVALPVRSLFRAGVQVLVVTCAAGGIDPAAVPGGFMLFADHLNYQGVNPLVGPLDLRLGERFVDMSAAYDAALRRQAARAAVPLKLKVFEGVYAALLGPSFETPAEIRALATLGAGAVGMSTVPEVIAARQAGVRVLGIASITNRAAGLSAAPLDHREVLDLGKRSSLNLIHWLDALMPRLMPAAPGSEKKA